MKTKARSIAIWSAVAIVGAVAWGVIALVRDEEISAAWLILAAVGSYAIAYRFYARFIARKVLRRRRQPGHPGRAAATTASTSSRPTGGCCSATTSPPSPGPGRWSARCWPPRWATCRARSGSSSGVIFAGAVQDMVILFFSMRRDGKSLGQMARDEIGPVGGAAALVAVLRHHDHPARGAGAGRGQRAGGLAVGHVLARDDHPDRPVHGLLHAGAAAGPGAGDHGDRRRAAAARDRRSAACVQDSSLAAAVHAVARGAGRLPDRVRLRRPRCCRCGCCSRRATTCRPS